MWPRKPRNDKSPAAPSGQPQPTLPSSGTVPLRQVDRGPKATNERTSLRLFGPWQRTCPRTCLCTLPHARLHSCLGHNYYICYGHNYLGHCAHHNYTSVLHPCIKCMSLHMLTNRIADTGWTTRDRRRCAPSELLRSEIKRFPTNPPCILTSGNTTGGL